MLTIFVSRRMLKLTTADGQTVKVCRTYVRQGKQLQYLNNIDSFEDLSGIRFVVKEWRWSALRCTLKRLSRDDKLGSAIIHFLKTYHVDQDMNFDCYAFANLVNGVQPHKCIEMCDHWSMRTYTPHIKVGDTVFLISPAYKMFNHAAIYIGRGLYISVYGCGGSLEIATLERMVKDFGAHVVRIATPKTAR